MQIVLYRIALRFKANHKISPYKILSRRKMGHAYAQLKMSETPIHSDSPMPSIFLAPFTTRRSQTTLAN